MDETPSPDDTLPDEAYFDTLAEVEVIVESTSPRFGRRFKPATPADEE